MTPVRKHNSSNPIAVRRLPVTFTSDVRRVITRFFDIVFRTGMIHSDHEVEMDDGPAQPLSP
jgi:hypothetical protein